MIADISDMLLELMAVDGRNVDGFKLGRWFPLERLPACRQKFPDQPFLFHGGNMIAAFGENLGAEERLKEYLDSTNSPWISVHLMVWETGLMERLWRGEHLPLPDPENAFSRLLRRLELLVNLVQVPVLVENIEALPIAGYDFWARPDFISRVIEQSGCSLLLDTGHLRVSADQLGMTVKAYMEQLPLEKVTEIHVSGPRRRNGRLLDAHQPLQAVDYRLLKELLSGCRPWAVTLEYNRDREQLSKQLDRIRRILDMIFAEPIRKVE